MREAIGTSFIFNLIMIFTGVMIVLYVGSIAYTKGFKIRNRMLDIIEKHDGFPSGTGEVDAAKNEIEADLAKIGYKVLQDGQPANCDDDRGGRIMAENDYNYCVYEFQDRNGKYYGVTVFIHFDIPIIGGIFQIPIYGETRTIFDKGVIDG